MNYRRERRFKHINVLNYVNSLPNFESSGSSSSSEHYQPSDISLCSSQNELETSSSTDHQEIHLIPESKEYFDAVFLAILSHAGLNLHASEIVVNLMNISNTRFSNDPVIFPSIRHFWNKQSKENLVHIYILCEKGHAHGPFRGDSKSNEFFLCEGVQFRVNTHLQHYFIHLPLRKQFENFLPMIPSDAWQQEKDNSHMPDDISNARQAKLVKSSTIAGKIKLTMTMHSDEVSCSKSSSTKILPVFISINELKPQTRKKFFFLTGLYVGRTKPTVEIYLTPLIEEIKSLSINCSRMAIMGEEESSISFHLIGLIADAPMRAYLRNVRQYNHMNGCDWCIIQVTTANGARVFPNLPQREIKEIKRKKKDFLDFKESCDREEDQFLNLNPRFKGINGISPLLLLDDFDIVDGTAVEPMHSICLGVFRNFLLKGIMKNNDTSLYESNVSKNHFISELGRRLSSIKVNSETARITRGLEQIKFWKSCEYDSFLSYFFFASVRGLLKPAVIRYISCLSRIYYLSHTCPVTSVVMAEIDNLVEEFQIGTASLFGSGFLTYNLHILSHLSSSLRNLGPNSNVSSYPLEDHMGKLKDKVRRYSHIGPALIRVFQSELKYVECCERKLSKWNLTEKEKITFGLIETSEKITKIPLDSVPDTILTTVLENIRGEFHRNIRPSDIKFYKSISSKGIRYSSYDYCKNKQRNDSTLLFSDDFYRIQSIVQIEGKTLFFCEKFSSRKISQSFQGFSGYCSFSLDHLYEVTLTDRISYFDLNCCPIKCIYIQSTVFHFKYKKDFIVKPFLKNK